MYNKKIPIRKIVLLFAIITLALIYILQLIFTGKSKIKILSIQEEISSVQISFEGNSLTAQKDGTKWKVGIPGEKMYDASEGKIKVIFDSLKDIKLLGTISSSSNDDERYGLSLPVNIKAFSDDGKILREINVGKNTSTNSQSYIKVDNKDEIFLAQGALKTIFTKTIADLREKNIYDFDASQIISVSVKTQNDDFEILRNAPKVGEELESAWSFSRTNVSGELDDEKVNSFVNGISSLDADTWLSDDAEFPDDVSATITIKTQTKTVTLRLSLNEDEDATATSSETPYIFTLTKYVASRFNKEVASLLKS